MTTSLKTVSEPPDEGPPPEAPDSISAREDNMSAAVERTLAGIERVRLEGSAEAGPPRPEVPEPTPEARAALLLRLLPLLSWRRPPTEELRSVNSGEVIIKSLLNL